MSKLKSYIVHFFKGTDKLLTLICMIASAFGVVMVYSATRYSLGGAGGLTRDARTMIFAIVIGVIGAILISLVDYDIICRVWYVWAVLGVGLMILVQLIGVAPNARADARTWINLGIFYFQPSELVKIFFIITFSVHLNYVREEINSFRNVILLMLHAFVPFGLVAISGDDGSALVFMIIAIALLFVAGINWKYILGAIALVAAAVPLLWFKMSEFQKQRFIVIVNPDKYPNTAYQQKLGMNAMRNGGFLGSGLFRGTYTQSGSIPEGENDMIFTVIGEEVGVLGCIIALLLIASILLRIIRDGNRAIAGPAQYLCYGVAFMIAAQTLINVAMCLRLGPVIGITLPFFSAGGSSTLGLYVGIGLVLSVYRSNFEQKQETNFRLIGIRSPFNENIESSISYNKKEAAKKQKISRKTKQNVNTPKRKTSAPRHSKTYTNSRKK